MKQNFTCFFFLAFFVALLMPSSVLAEEIPVAILTTNADGKTKTLTFTYAKTSTAAATKDSILMALIR